MPVPRATRPTTVAVVLAVLAGALPGGIGAAAAGARPAQQDPSSSGRPRVEDLGGFSGSVPTAASTENLCVLARSADGRSPAVKARTFAFPGIDRALFSIGVLPGEGVPEGTWNLRAMACDGSSTAPSTRRFALDDVRVDGGIVTAGLELEPTDGAASIEGTVVDRRKERVAGLCVTATGSGAGAGPAGAGATTSDQGEYRITGLDPGRYRVVAATCDGEKGDLRGAAIDDAGEVREVRVTADGAEGITVVTAPGSRISGRLVDDQGGALSGVCVVAGDRRARTDRSGSFDLRGVAGEVTSLSASSCGDGQGVVATRLALPSGDDPVELDREVRRAGSVEGTVTDGDGLPVPGVVVAARRTAKGADVATTVTAPTGRYRLTGVAPGRYLVAINPGEAAGLPAAWTNADGVTNSADGAATRSVGTDGPVRLSVALGEPSAGSEVAIATTPVDNASITVDGIRRADGQATIPLTLGDHLVEYGDVTGWIAPDNEAVEVSDERSDGQDLTGTYAGPLVRLNAEVPSGSVPVTLNGRPIGTGRVSFVVPPDELVRVCSSGCLPEARAADLATRVLRPSSATAPASPTIRAAALGAATTVLDAEVSLDGQLRAIGRVALPVDAGRHDIRFGDVPGYLTPLPHRLDIDADRPIPVVARYRRLVKTTIDIGSDDGVIWLDGDPVGSGTVTVGVQPGRHQLCADVDEAVRCAIIGAVDGQPLDVPPERFTR